MNFNLARWLVDMGKGMLLGVLSAYRWENHLYADGFRVS